MLLCDGDQILGQTKPFGVSALVCAEFNHEAVDRRGIDERVAVNSLALGKLEASLLSLLPTALIVWETLLTVKLVTVYAARCVYESHVGILLAKPNILSMLLVCMFTVKAMRLGRAVP